MTRIFLSYSHVDRRFVEALADKLRRIYGHDNVWFDEGLDGGDIWWEEILEQIASRDIFVYVLSNDSVQSDYCQAEFTEARRLQKQIITVQARDRTRLTDELGDIHYINMANGVDDADALTDLYRSVNKRMTKVPKRTPKPLWEPATPRPVRIDEKPRSTNAPDIDTPTLEIPLAERENARADNKPWWKKPEFIIGAILIPIVAAVLGAVIQNMGNNNPHQPPNPTTAVVKNATETPIDAFTPTLSGFQQLQTTEAEVTQSAGTQDAFDLTATQQFISDSNATATAAQFAATETAAYATLFALSATPTLDPLQVAFTPVTRNTDWTPYERKFDGVAMVLVPVGCFMMGSEDGSNDKQPIHEQCFDQPFWIDKYEVTQAQFQGFGGKQAISPIFSGNDRPVERITWFEARNFCELRDAQLPTEARWEYAARGPENWIYPWGNIWNTSNAVWNRGLSQGTASTGSIPTGISWVGALDMGGNVWEWTSSMYESYPYDAEDGREADIDSGNDISRVLRGGSWNSGGSGLLRASYRHWGFSTGWDDDIGFRCARSYE